MSAKLLFIFGTLSLIGQSFALVCKKTGTPTTVTCDTDKGPPVCQVSWSINTGGSGDVTYTNTPGGCAYGKSEVTCESTGEGRGTCYCKGSDNCNTEAEAVASTAANRVNCYYCTSGSCSYADLETDLGRTIKCPVNVNCLVSRYSDHSRFTRTCDWDSFNDLNTDYNIGCLGDTCICKTDKCNTGFHGRKCHNYEESTCGNGEGASGGDIECLTGTTHCAVATIEHPDADCQTTVYGCAVGRTEVGCETVEKYNYLGDAEVCYCTSGDLCDPRGGGASGLLAFSASLLVSLAFLIAK